MTNVIELAKQAGFQKFLKPADRPEMICDPAALERFATLVRNAAMEEAAIAAWNHYMDTCKANKIAPASQERWLASQPIRNLKEPTP